MEKQIKADLTPLVNSLKESLRKFLDIFNPKRTHILFYQAPDSDKIEYIGTIFH